MYVMDKQLLNRYDNATQDLVKQVKNLKMPTGFKSQYDMGEYVIKFREMFKNPAVRKLLLNRAQERQRLSNGLFSAGFCGISSYTWMQMFRMPDNSAIWRLKQYDNDKKNPVLSDDHMWLENVYDGSVLDLTFDQFIDKNNNYVQVPYNAGKNIDTNTYNNLYIGPIKAFAYYVGINLSDCILKNKARSR